MEKKYRADNGLGNVFWIILSIILLSLLIYWLVIAHRENILKAALYLAFTIIFILSVTIKEYAITENNFLEIRFVLRLFNKKRRIAIGDMVGLMKIKNNQLRIDKVRGFEILRVKESDIDALIEELIYRNPRIKMPEED